MQYRSFTDLSRTIQLRASILPNEIDLVVGIPRSGLFPASMIALLRNLPLSDVDGYAQGRILAVGITRRPTSFQDGVSNYRNVLVVDDSILSGAAMREAKAKLAAISSQVKIHYCAVYGNDPSHLDADIILEAVPTPRLFQWNVLHHPFLVKCCLDIDNVLVPKRRGNVEAAFVDAFNPPFVPTRKVGHLITGHPADVRDELQSLLDAAGVEFGTLWMPGRHEDVSSFKARAYLESGSDLALVGTDHAAAELAERSAREVLSLQSHLIIAPEQIDKFRGMLDLQDRWLRSRERSELVHRRIRRYRHIWRRLTRGYPA